MTLVVDGSRQAGTQCLDRSWRSLKGFLGPKIAVTKKVDGHRVLLPSVESGSPPKFLKELENLLKT